MPSFIIRIAIILTFYIIAAFSTTDILRLLKGSVVSVSASDCFCPVCGKKIPLRSQLPIFSYFFSHGKCQFCKSKIPASELCLELFLFVALSVIAFFFGFSYSGLAACILFYETIKFVCLFRFGRRECDFPKNLLLSLLHNLIIFCLLAFLFFLEHLAG